MREDWTKIEFRNIVDKFPTSNYKVKQKDYLQIGEFPIIDQGQELIGGYENDKGKLLGCDLPLVVFGDHTRCVKFINFPFVPGADGIKVLMPKFFINPKYLFFVVKVLANKIENKGYARHYQLIEKQCIGLPPLPEQRAIVRKLESLFSSLDAGVADFKKAQQQLKIYRQAVLKKAFEGEFEEVKFKELGDAIDPQPSHRTPPVDNNGIPYVSIKDIVNNKLELSRARLVSKRILEEHLNRYTLVENDFIIGKIGTIGNPVRVTLPQNYTLSANVVLIQPRQINSNYLYYYFKSPNIEQQFNSGKKATTQAAFGIQKVRDLIVRYPQSIDQQRRIVLDIESRLSVCDFMEQNIKESLNKSKALRQSILKKAFEGKLLTAQELAECKQAADYEPASLLLERIKAEQKEAKPEKKVSYRHAKVSL